MTATITPQPGGAGWHKEDVEVHFSGTDAVPGSGVAACLPDVILTGEGVGLSASGTCFDVAGNISASATATVNIDRTPPTVAIVTPSGGSYAHGAAISASYSCADALSDIVQCDGPVASGGPLDTATVGERTFSVTATDRAGNRSIATATIRHELTAPRHDTSRDRRRLLRRDWQQRLVYERRAVELERAGRGVAGQRDQRL